MGEFFDSSLPCPKVGDWVGGIIIHWPDGVAPHPSLLTAFQKDLNRVHGLALPLDKLDLVIALEASNREDAETETLELSEAILARLDLGKQALQAFGTCRISYVNANLSADLD